MVKKLKISNILGCVSLFFIQVSSIYSQIIYDNDPQTHQELNKGTTAVVIGAVLNLLIVAAILLIITKHPFIGGIAMTLLGLYSILVAVGMFFEIILMLSQGDSPYLLLYLMVPQNFVMGLLLLAGGILAILGSKENPTLKISSAKWHI